jgi:hypothetical protein
MKIFPYDIAVYLSKSKLFYHRKTISVYNVERLQQAGSIYLVTKTSNSILRSEMIIANAGL